VEIQFYLFSSVIYYINKKKFVRNFLFISLLLVTINFLFLRVQHGNRLSLIIHFPPYLFSAYETWIERGFDLVFYLPFFCSGALFYLLFKSRQGKYVVSMLEILCFAYLVIFTIYTGVSWPVRLIYMVMFLLFFGFIYIPDRLSFFKNKILTSTGEASYFLYLIHQYIGVLLIYTFGQYFLPLGFVFPFIIILILVTVSNLYFHFIDKKIGRFLKTKLIKESRRQKVPEKITVESIPVK
jgi:peptidoglycan/LPS O-acetylase OafA/YrhL